MIALVRYTVESLAHTQRWVAPIFALVVVTTLVLSAPPLTMDSVGALIILLFPVSAWLTYAVGTIETMAQEHVTVSHAGASSRVWVARVLTSLLIAVALPIVTVIVGACFAGWNPADVGIAILALVVTSVTGCSLGTLTVSLIPVQPGWALLIISFGALADLLIEGAPPIRAYITALAMDAHDIGMLIAATAGGLALSAALFFVSALRLRARA